MRNKNWSKAKFFFKIIQQVENLQGNMSQQQAEIHKRGNEEDIDEEEKRRKQMKKRRTILKPFQDYTVQQSEEGRFKGWSKQAADHMTAYCKKLKYKKPEFVQFRSAYREIYRDRNKTKRKSVEVKTLQVDYSDLWDVDDVDNIQHIEI